MVSVTIGACTDMTRAYGDGMAGRMTGFALPPDAGGASP
jgi:hypothetical protein